MEDLSHPAPHRATPAGDDRPLAGLTVLLVEDSRFASEAIRLLCLRSGARIRRADSLVSARRHLSVYRPSAVIVDLGLPDGPGEVLLSELAHARPRVPVLIGTSGDPGGRIAARGSGADGFLEKPVESLSAFQAVLLDHLPSRAAGPRRVDIATDLVRPDRLAMADDLTQMAEMMRGDMSGGMLDYAAQFLGGLGKSAHDTALETAAHSLASARAAGRVSRGELNRLLGMIEARLAATAPV